MPLSKARYLLGWHVLYGDRKLQYNDGRVVRTGVVMKQPDITRPTLRCRYGMHASLDLEHMVSCIPWIPEPEISYHSEATEPWHRWVWICRVAIRGSIDRPNTWSKYQCAAAEERIVLWMIKVDYRDRARIVEARDDTVRIRNIILGIKRHQKPRVAIVPYWWR